MWRPDDFRVDPYGYLTNQISHGYLGMYSITFYCWSVFHLTGDYPSQDISGLMLIAVYFVIWEIGYQGWRGWDTMEDTYFVYMGIFPWHFIDMSQIIDKLFVWEVLVAVSLTLGTVARIHNARKN